MEFDSTFEVGSPVGEVWAAMLDLERAAHCLPGARVLERTGEHAYRIAMRARVGSAPTSYTGDLRVLDQDPDKHVATMSVEAKEARGPGSASANVVIRLAERDGGTRGTIFTQMAVSGRAGSVRQDTVGEAAGRTVEAFARNLEAMLGGRPLPVTSLPVGGTNPAGGEPEAGAPPAPEPAAEEPAPVPEPAPEPKPAPKPEPKPAPKPKPEPKLAPKPKPEPKPAPAPPPAPADGLRARLGDPRVLAGAAAALALVAVAVRRLVRR
jgi:carbon monoxide dehydrogenase subunit G